MYVRSMRRFYMYRHEFIRKVVVFMTKHSIEKSADAPHPRQPMKITYLEVNHSGRIIGTR